MRKNLTVVIITILILCFCSAYCYGTSLEELQEKQNTITTQIEQKNEELTTVQNDITGTLQEIENLTQKIIDYEFEVQKLTNQATALGKKIEELEKKLEKAEKSYEEERDLVEARLLAIYEAGETHYLDVLLNSNSISEFISTYFYLQEIVKNDAAALQDIEREKNKIEHDQNILLEQKKQLKETKSNKERTYILLENTKTTKNEYKNKLTEEEKKIQDDIDKYEEELMLVQASIVLRATGELGEEYSGGVMAWPVPGYTRITSEFGMRYHPILYIYKLHTGMDIGAPEGANFIAASDGVVISAEYNYSYGNMVIIDHGGGITTLYAHGSKILVTVGQTVKRGTPVLKVGSTGYSTGPHAHFEVRIDGQPVQPLNFLKADNSEKQNKESNNKIVNNTTNNTTVRN